MIGAVNVFPVSACRLIGLFVVVSVLAACGTGAREIRGEAPLFSVESLIVDDAEVIVSIRLRNVNDRSLQIQQLQMSLLIEDRLLLERETHPQLEISARGRDVVRVRGVGEPAGMTTLEQLSGLVPSDEEARLPINAAWTLKLSLINERGRSQDGQATGFLHPVPGRPGHFR